MCPGLFFKTALTQGYKVITLSFISLLGVSQICIGCKLDEDPDCTENFRRQRIYEYRPFADIPDKVQDAIILRLVHLLKYLAIRNPAGQWRRYLNDKTGAPAWDKIAIAGQSQGGGMAQFIGQRELVVRVISFSGGWDYSNSKTKTIAGWYSKKCVI